MGIKVFLPAIHMVPLLAGHIVVALSVTHQVYRLSHLPVSEHLCLEHAVHELLQDGVPPLYGELESAAALVAA